MRNIIILFTFLLSLYSCKKNETTNKIKPVKKIQKPVYKYGYKLDDYKVTFDTIKNGESFGTILDKHHIYYPKINLIASTIKDIFDVRLIRAGKPYMVLAKKDSTEKAQVFIYEHDKINATIVDFRDSLIVGKRYERPIKTVVKTVGGVINSSLSVTMDSLHLSPTLSWTIADIYAWTLDFYKLQKGDSFKFIYEEKFIDDTIFAGYGEVKAAVFKHRGEKFYAYNFLTDSIKGTKEYYDQKGNMLKSQFLKSPIKFQYRISSRYNLKRRIAYYGNKVRPHRGTDFAANIGTPILTTASGTVVESAKRGGNGNFVKIKHNGTYSTQYLHMQRRKVNKGEFVKQGAVIGWVGMTGNTGGPHVCYRFWKNGKEVDPFKEKLPSAEPLPKSVKPKYAEFIKPLKYQLDNHQLIAPKQQVVKSIATN